MKSVLSAFSYYGGKAKLAPLICDMLDYSHSTMYIEPFGGGARVLLNKPRHEIEIYNDANAGLCAFMRIIGDSRRSDKLIDMLYHSEYSAEEFYSALAYCNRYEDNYIDEFTRLISFYLKHLYKKYQLEELQDIKRDISSIRRRKTGSVNLNSLESSLKDTPLTSRERLLLVELFSQYTRAQKLFAKTYEKTISAAFESLKPQIVNESKKRIKEITEDKSITTEKRQKTLKQLNSIINKFGALSYKELTKRERSIFERTMSKPIYELVHDKFNNNIAQSMEDVDEMKLAYSTYIVYSQSRDGMGKDWSNARFKSTFDYHGYISNLYDVAARMNGVRVFQEGALAFLLNENYLNRKDAMFYLDPSYLSPEDESKNLGSTYKFSSDFDAHELLLKTICNARAKILISNYDLPLYNKYLTTAGGWRKIEIDTKTTVGGTKDNKRKEILWYNY